MVTISITLDEQDMEDIESILNEGKSSGILEHILEQARYVQGEVKQTDPARELANQVFGFKGA